MGKKVFDQRALTRLKTRSGAGAHRDRRSRRRGKRAEGGRVGPGASRVKPPGRKEENVLPR